MRYKPMLAYPVSTKPIDYDKPVFIQPKLDGVRCVIQADRFRSPIAYSRTGKEWKNIKHILEELVPFFKNHPDVVLDGELYNHDFKDDFESIISMVRKTKPDAWARQESKLCVQFHCYDIIDESMKYHDRAKFLISNLRDSYCVRFLPAFSVDCEERSKLYHQENLGAGYEGSILRTNDVYKCGRSWSLRKFKDFSDAEATITGFVEGKGKRKGTLGKFLMVDDDGNEFGCPPGKGYNYQDMKNLLFRAPHYIGAKATFTYFERTKAGSYRHPLFKCIRDYE